MSTAADVSAAGLDAATLLSGYGSDSTARLLELAPVAIYVCDRDGLIVRHNRRAADLWGRSPRLLDPAERYCGSLRLYRLDGGRLLHSASPTADVLRTGEVVRNHEVVIERPDGSRRLVLVNVEPMRDATGAVMGAISCFQDITDHRAEARRSEDISERKRAQQQQILLIREMAHRVKNLFALVTGMIGLSARGASTAAELAQSLQARLSALARAHDLTLAQPGAMNWMERSTSLHALLQAIVSPHIGQAGGDRVTFEGPEVTIAGNAITSFALLMHELATNASKYGAWSTANGRVQVQWTADEGELRLTWTETGGPAIEQPLRHEGFGTLLARQTALSLQGSMEREWRAEGVVVQLTAQLERLA